MSENRGGCSNFVWRCGWFLWILVCFVPADRPVWTEKCISREFDSNTKIGGSIMYTAQHVFDCTLWRRALWTLNIGAKRRVYEEVAALSIWVAETETCCLRLMPLTGERFSAIKLNCSRWAGYLWRIGKLHLPTTKWSQKRNANSPGASVCFNETGT